MTRFRERKDHDITVKTYGDRGDADDMGIKDPEAGLNSPVFRVIFQDIFADLLERTAMEDNLVRKRLYAAQGATSSIIFFRGMGLWTALAAIVLQGKSIAETIWSKCSP